MGGVVVGVVGARGGAGTSVSAAALAVGFARRALATTLIDLAPENGGIEVVLGTEGETGLRWPDLADARGHLDGGALRERLPPWEGVAVVGASRDGPARMPQDAVADVCLALAEISDAVVVDLGRCLVAGQSYLSAVLGLCDEVLIVMPLDLIAVAGALVARDALAGVHSKVALIVRGPAPGTLDAVEISDVLGLEVVCEIGWDPRLAGDIERGLGPVSGRGPLVRASRALAARYAGGGAR